MASRDGWGTWSGVRATTCLAAWLAWSWWRTRGPRRRRDGRRPAFALDKQAACGLYNSESIDPAPVSRAFEGHHVTQTRFFPFGWRFFVGGFWFRKPARGPEV